ncbi:MAG: hypothetical protein A2633_01330 [Candidatus Sungbacteria bacterium RIFCSPHIGHO2_01_FULL_47_32]|uniref:Glycosyltransferase subfamily 4-like N-terminal domain-containing protein n=1 Tax=Candidatus Sungbacteria bacterium RIFCSPHIGHO2_01_FULL_47_32 TaxID=1802264 RepID=A0A1G2K5D9_9BACT|nr:MAG: hypothetical protein A2633_01330 [Candidatus Sungbacteria bacterium RIFCSPHIGHO2_01_FULL_47_32]
MKVLMLSIDPLIFEEGSEVRERMKEYGTLFDDLRVIVYTHPGYAKEELAQNVRIYPTNTGLKFSYFFKAFSLGRRILKEGGYKKNDAVITSQDAMTNIAGFLLRAFTGISLQVQIHTDFLSPNFKKESFKNSMRYRLYRWSARHADCVRVVSERLKASLEGKFRIHEWRISVLPIFVDGEAIRNAVPSTKVHDKYPSYDFIILMASRVTTEKNIDMACLAMREVIKKFPRTLLLVVGDGPEKNRLKDLYGTTPQRPVSFDDATEEKPFDGPMVIFEDAVPYETLLSYYKTADMFLVTSNYEGYGRTILEALASGLPVFSADVGIAREAIRINETGRIFPVGNSRNLADILIKVFYEFENYNLMRLRTKELSKTLLASSKSEYLESFRQSLVTCGSAPRN